MATEQIGIEKNVNVKMGHGKHRRSRHWFGEHEMRNLSCNLKLIEFPLKTER